MATLRNLSLWNIAIMLGGMQVAQRLEFNNPNVLNTCRTFWVFSNILIVSICLYIKVSIERKNDNTVFKHEKPSSSPNSTTGAKLTTETVHDHDLTELKKMFKGQLIGVGIFAVVHLLLKQNPPLIAQSIIPLKGTIQSNLAQIHIFGKPAVGELKRPFESAPGIIGSIISRVLSCIKSCIPVQGTPEFLLRKKYDKGTVRD